MNDEAWKQSLREKRLTSKEAAGYGAIALIGGLIVTLIGKASESDFIFGVGILIDGGGVILLIGGLLFYYVIYEAD